MKTILLFFALSASLTTPAYSQPINIKRRFSKVLIAFGNEDYQKALKELSKIFRTPDNGKWFDYYAGMAYLRTNEFEKAIIFLRRSMARKIEKENTAYELGQAYYATSKLVMAYKAFAVSYKREYKKNVSLYYLAHISQLLERNANAYKLYKKLAEVPDVPINLLQIAKFQMGETLYVINEKKSNLRGVCQNTIIPLLEQAIEVDATSQIVPDIQRRLAEIKARQGLDPNYMISGIRKPEKTLHSAFVSQGFTYDNNLTLVTALPTQQTANRDAFVFQTKATYFQNHYVGQRYTITPVLDMGHTIHSDRDSEDVLENDGYDFGLGLKTRIDHYFRNKAAFLTLDVEYDHSARDNDSLKGYEFFSRGLSFSIGETLPLFEFGATSLAYKYSKTDSYLEASDNNSHSLTLVQTYKNKKSQDLFIFLAIYSKNEVPNNTVDNTNAFTMRLEYIAPEILPKYIFNAGMGITFTDTLAQQATRGTEKTYSPSIKITRKTNSGLRPTLFYSYTKNSSLDVETRDYSKQQYGFELKYIY